jgi:signal transduction histidine kinase
MGAIRVGLATGLRKGPGAELERAVADAIALLGEEIGRLRGLITDLRPAALDEFGLAPALEELARRAELRDDNRVTMTIALANELGIEETRLDPELESTVYRIVQESLRNAGRHAQASVVAVSVIEQDNTLTVTVEDDGAGFDPRASRSGFGLRGLRERADLRGGAITIASEPGAGTTLTATLPVERVTPEATP